MPIFVILQCLDVLTTLIFLSKGVKEGNPLIAGWFPHTHAPWVGLVAAKLMAMLIGVYCYRNGRLGALRLANMGYCAIVAWNLMTIAAAAIVA